MVQKKGKIARMKAAVVDAVEVDAAEVENGRTDRPTDGQNLL